MGANTFGQHFKITSFGESHGVALGVVIEGCPSGVKFDEPLLLDFLERRRPGAHMATSTRQEADRPEILSGIFDEHTLGTPICVIVRNNDARSSDYDAIKNIPRAGHADDVWREKFGISDHRGGGRSSGRETLARVIGGAFAKMFLQTPVKSDFSNTHANFSQKNILVKVTPTLIGPLVVSDYEKQKSEIDNFLMGLKTEGNSVGGVVEVRIEGHPKNLGQPVFHKLKADFAAAYMSVGAVTGVEFGGGFKLAELRGTDVHTANVHTANVHTANVNSAIAPPPSDAHLHRETPTRSQEIYGGIRGGISTGEPIVFRVAFKPTSSILDIAKKGRHDPCIVLRAMPVLEGMTYLVLADHVLWSRLDRV